MNITVEQLDKELNIQIGPELSFAEQCAIRARVLLLSDLEPDTNNHGELQFLEDLRSKVRSGYVLNFQDDLFISELYGVLLNVLGGS